MSSVQDRPGPATDTIGREPIEVKLEVVVIPVSDVKHEARIGREDPEWPGWYAEYMVSERAGEELPA
jgi:hypothetical protein